MLNDKTLLVTGGTGSFGKAFVRHTLQSYAPRKLIIYSRDEFKQYQMRQEFAAHQHVLRFFLGDVRDKERLLRAFEDVDYVIHAAALKQVPALEYNPTEAVHTNVTGAENIVNAALDTGVQKVVALSTDKAVNPINLYGATKLVAEKVFIAANAYGGRRTVFSVVRYGNVTGSRGSVIPLFLRLKQSGAKELPITDERMTRFWVTLPQSVELVLKALRESQGGEVFVPKLPSMKIVDLARAIVPNCPFRITGIRPGEKMHEALLSPDEVRHTKEYDGIYVVIPEFYESRTVHEKYEKFPWLPDGFVYQSDTNEQWLTAEQLRAMVEELDLA